MIFEAEMILVGTAHHFSLRLT